MAANGNATSNDWMDFEAPEGAQGATGYPTIQWFNGGQGNQHPVMKTGGWELPVKWFGDILGNQPTFNVEHNGAESGTDAAYLFETLNFAAVMKHTCFYRGVGKDRVWATEYKDGFFSRVKMLGFVKEVESVAPLTPVVITFRSSVARDFNAVARSFRGEVLATADKVASEIARQADRQAPDKFMPYAFWLPFGAVGKRVKTGSGQKSQYAPLEGKWNSDVFASDDQTKVIAALKELATPADLRNYVRDSFYEEACLWLEAEKAKLAGQVEGQEYAAPEVEE